MQIIKESDFRKEIRSAPRAGYLFFGDEDYLKAFAIRQARELICPDPSLSFFNEMRLDAIDFTPQKLLDALLPLPMMADRKLITLSGLNFNSMRADEINGLLDVLAALPEYDYNLLIIHVAADALNPGYLPKSPSEILKKLGEYLTPVQFERCTTAKLTAWVEKHFAHNGVEASPALCSSMTEYCGHSMFILAGEIDKLSFYTLAQGRQTATEQDMRVCCTPVAEYDAFALTNAVMDRRQDTALGILTEYRLRRIDPIIILHEVTTVVCNMIAIRNLSAEGVPQAEIGSHLGRMHEYTVKLYLKSLRNVTEKRLKNMLEQCVAADAALKNFQQQGYGLLERLICSI